MGTEAVTQNTADQLSKAVCKEQRRADDACLCFVESPVLDDRRHGSVIIESGDIAGKINQGDEHAKSCNVLVLRKEFHKYVTFCPCNPV